MKSQLMYFIVSWISPHLVVSMDLVFIQPNNPVTTGNHIKMQCLVSKAYISKHSVFKFTIDDKVWDFPDGLDVDDNAYIEFKISHHGQVICHVSTSNNTNIHNATTTVYFIKDDNDPVVVAEYKDIEIPCMSDTTGDNADLMSVWQVDGVKIPNDTYDRFTVDGQNGNLLLKRAAINDIGISVTCTVISKAAYDFYRGDVGRAVELNSAYAFKKRISVLQFKKQGGTQTSMYEVYVYGNTVGKLQWYVSGREMDSNATTLNFSSITVPSSFIPSLSVAYSGSVLWNDTVHIVSVQSESHHEKDQVGMIIGIVVSLVVVVSAVALGYGLFKRRNRLWNSLPEWLRGRFNDQPTTNAEELRRLNASTNGAATTPVKKPETSERNGTVDGQHQV